jgi:hypothetical protein
VLGEETGLVAAIEFAKPAKVIAVEWTIGPDG